MCSPGNSRVLGRPLRTWKHVPMVVELMVGQLVGFFSWRDLKMVSRWANTAL